MPFTYLRAYYELTAGQATCLGPQMDVDSMAANQLGHQKSRERHASGFDNLIHGGHDFPPEIHFAGGSKLAEKNFVNTISG